MMIFRLQRRTKKNSLPLWNAGAQVISDLVWFSSHIINLPTSSHARLKRKRMNAQFRVRLWKVRKFAKMRSEELNVRPARSLQIWSHFMFFGYLIQPYNIFCLRRTFVAATNSNSSQVYPTRQNSLNSVSGGGQYGMDDSGRHRSCPWPYHFHIFVIDHRWIVNNVIQRFRRVVQRDQWTLKFRSREPNAENTLFFSRKSVILTLEIQRPQDDYNLLAWQLGDVLEGEELAQKRSDQQRKNFDSQIKKFERSNHSIAIDLNWFLANSEPQD